MREANDRAHDGSNFRNGAAPVGTAAPPLPCFGGDTEASRGRNATIKTVPEMPVVVGGVSASQPAAI